MNLNQLKYFLVVAEIGSFTRAAERLFITQPSLSVGIQKLEEDLGVSLFERGKKQILLTPAGKYFFKKAKNILNEIELVKNELRHNSDSNSASTLRIGILDTLPAVSLANVINNFGKIYPNIVIEHIIGNTLDLDGWMHRGEIDVAISILNNHPKSTSQFLFLDNCSLAVAEGHFLSKEKTLSFKVLNSIPYIERVGCELQLELQRLFVARGIYPQIIYRATHNEWIYALVATGIGVAVMPSRISIPGIVNICFSDFNLVREVGLLWRDKHKPKAADLFHEFLNSYIAQMSS